MKKLIIMAVFAVMLIFASGCSQQGTPSTSKLCGDGVCSADETCNCADCVGDPKCAGSTQSCNDNIACTTDTYNPRTGKCEHTASELCCGDGLCEDSERCDNATLKTVCPDDCGLQCPAKVIMHKEGDVTQTAITATCVGNCLEVSPNNYQVTGSGKLTTVIENIGEKAAGTVSSMSYCTFGSGIRNKDGELGGVALKFYFNAGELSLKSLSGTSSGNNQATFTIDFDTTNFDATKTMTCVLSISATGFEQRETVQLTLMKE